MAPRNLLFVFFFPLMAASSVSAAGDLADKIYYLSEGADCEAKGESGAAIGTLSELKTRLTGKKGVYCISWSITKEDYGRFSDPTLYIGRVGDVSELYLDNLRIGLTGRAPGAGWHLQTLHSYYYLPPGLLKETNEFTVKVHKFFLSGSGPMDNIEIGNWDDIRRRAKFNDYLHSDLLVFLSILFGFVGVLIFGIFRHHPNFGSYISFSFACLTGGLFSLTLSRIIYAFSSNYANIYKLNCTAGILFFYFLISYFYGDLRQARFLAAINAIGTVLFMSAIIFSANLRAMTSFYAGWMFFLYFNIVALLLSTFINRRQLGGYFSRAMGIGILLAAVTHDILVYCGYISGGNITPYAIFAVLISFVFIVLTDMKQIYLAASKTDFAVSEQNRLQNDLLRVAKVAAIGQMAAQVAHDIRSPLTALDSALKNTSQLPEQQRIVVRHAVNRIRDIANSLLEKNRQQAKATTAGGAVVAEPPEICLLSSIVDPVVTEKRLQFESKPGIDIDFELTQESYGLFAKIQQVEFKRLVSNMVNNAVEVLGDKGAVTVGLTHEDGSIVLTVEDNGKGIPPEILAKLGQRGETHGKTGGSGLGLYHARVTVESWGGSLKITSELGNGTTITIKLPAAGAPVWFVSTLELPAGKAVVVLDDDETIHQVWRGRFESVRLKEHGIAVYHFSEPGKLRGWVMDNPEKAESARYLFDYELLGHKETGLSMAQELNIASKVILVTSRYEEKRIIDECNRLGIRKIPKGLAGLVPIKIVDSGQSSAADSQTASWTVLPDQAAPAAAAPRAAGKAAVAVLLDDDALVHMTWEMAAEDKGVTLNAYTTPSEFLSNLAAFPKDTPIYIDSDLGNGIKGEDIAKDLREKGFACIYLETGHPPERFLHLPWLKVIGKEPPWGA